MSNVFDPANYPVEVPNTLQKGDYWAWKRTGLTQDYPFATYSLKYKFYHVSGDTASNFTITASESNDTFIFTSSNTAANAAGDYRWTAIVFKEDGAEAIIGEGFTTIVDNSIRSHSKIVLDSIEAVIEGRANMDQSSMSIAGRSLSRMSIDELLTFRDRYKTEWLKEIKLARIKNKQGSGNTIKVNFGRNSGYTHKSST